MAQTGNNCNLPDLVLASATVVQLFRPKSGSLAMEAKQDCSFQKSSCDVDAAKAEDADAKAHDAHQGSHWNLPQPWQLRDLEL